MDDDNLTGLSRYGARGTTMDYFTAGNVVELWFEYIDNFVGPYTMNWGKNNGGFIVDFFDGLILIEKVN